ncbi:unnamed protein product [Acanthosepion pharaonis]|uniref:Uncharacterized protein n=1 Tax=Acanthosepion pharaonis TaxID=158019 RepID=A0A812DQM6_ACAPH|nr:unnamed protein product [Sepia pharaonis]
MLLSYRILLTGANSSALFFPLSHSLSIPFSLSLTLFHSLTHSLYLPHTFSFSFSLSLLAFQSLPRLFSHIDTLIFCFRYTYFYLLISSFFFFTVFSFSYFYVHLDNLKSLPSTKDFLSMLFTSYLDLLEVHVVFMPVYIVVVYLKSIPFCLIICSSFFFLICYIFLFFFQIFLFLFSLIFPFFLFFCYFYILEFYVVLLFIECFSLLNFFLRHILDIPFGFLFPSFILYLFHLYLFIPSFNLFFSTVALCFSLTFYSALFPFYFSPFSKHSNQIFFIYHILTRFCFSSFYQQEFFPFFHRCIFFFSSRYSFSHSSQPNTSSIFLRKIAQLKHKNQNGWLCLRGGHLDYGSISTFCQARLFFFFHFVLFSLSVFL